MPKRAGRHKAASKQSRAAQHADDPAVRKKLERAAAKGSQYLRGIVQQSFDREGYLSSYADR
jgi:hypothetical protein